MSETIKSNISSKLCEVCQSMQGKYRCPGCQKVTCSLNCSKEHKKINDCTGKVSRSEFVEKKNFESVVQADFKLLEGTETTLDRLGRANKGFGQLNYTPKFHQILAREGRKRGTYFLSMSNVFKRHQLNKSFFVISSKMIQWTIEWKFDLGDHIETFYQHKVLEESTVSNAFEDLYESLTKPKAAIIREFKRSNECDLKVFFYHLKKTKAITNRFEPIDMSAILKDALSGKTVVEFPTLYVVLKRDWPKYLQQQSSELQQHDDSLETDE